ncbi:RNA-binding protein 25, partial [Ophiophagus hannah]
MGSSMNPKVRKTKPLVQRCSLENQPIPPLTGPAPLYSLLPEGILQDPSPGMPIKPCPPSHQAMPTEHHSHQATPTKPCPKLISWVFFGCCAQKNGAGKQFSGVGRDWGCCSNLPLPCPPSHAHRTSGLLGPGRCCGLVPVTDPDQIPVCQAEARRTTFLAGLFWKMNSKQTRVPRGEPTIMRGRREGERKDGREGGRKRRRRRREGREEGRIRRRRKEGEKEKEGGRGEGRRKEGEKKKEGGRGREVGKERIKRRSKGGEEKEGGRGGGKERRRRRRRKEGRKERRSREKEKEKEGGREGGEEGMKKEKEKMTIEIMNLMRLLGRNTEAAHHHWTSSELLSNFPILSCSSRLRSQVRPVRRFHPGLQGTPSNPEQLSTIRLSPSGQHDELEKNRHVSRAIPANLLSVIGINLHLKERAEGHLKSFLVPPCFCYKDPSESVRIPREKTRLSRPSAGPIISNTPYNGRGGQSMRRKWCVLFYFLLSTAVINATLAEYLKHNCPVLLFSSPETFPHEAQIMKLEREREREREKSSHYRHTNVLSVDNTDEERTVSADSSPAGDLPPFLTEGSPVSS